MRAVVQRVSYAKVTVDAMTVGQAKRGLLVLLGAGDGDGETDVKYICDKVANLRIFEDEAGKMNRSVLDIQGDVCVVSQFTLYGDVRKGRRPNFMKAADPTLANELYEQVVHGLRSYGLTVSTGQFQAHMMVELTNDGPVTILLDSERTF